MSLDQGLEGGHNMILFDKCRFRESAYSRTFDHRKKPR